MQPSPNEHPELITVSDAAGMAGRSTSWIREWIAVGQLAAYRAGPRSILHVDRAELCVFLRSHPRRRKIQFPRLRLVIDNT